MKEKAEQIAPLYDENGNELPLKGELDALPVDNLEEALAALEEAEAKANSIVADPNIIRQYEERKISIERLETELESMTSDKEQRLHNLNLKREPWEASLENAVKKVDVLFSKYMKDLGCTGKDSLTIGILILIDVY